mgnify:CR=1 FL=1
MRILFVSNLFPDQVEPWRGLDNAGLLEALRRASSGLTVKVIALRPTLSLRSLHWRAREVDEWTSPTFVPVAYVPKLGGLNHLLSAMAVGRVVGQLGIQAGEYDLLLTPWLFPDACGVRMVSALSGLPQLAIAQGSDVHRYLEMPMRRRAIFRFMSMVDGVVTRSGDLAKRLVEGGACSDRVHPIYNGVDTECFHPAVQGSAREKLELPTGVSLALFVGNFLPVKGLELLLGAVSILRSRGKALHVALIGSGPLQAELVSLASKLGISDQVHWRGRRDPSEVAQHMQACDVVCLSSLNEGVPNVVLEAMAVGRPIVSTDVGGIHEVLGPEAAMHALVPIRDPAAYAEALARILASRPSDGTIAKYGAKFSWKNCAQRHLELIDQIVANPIQNASEF